jgi:hypothetical protein
MGVPGFDQDDRECFIALVLAHELQVASQQAGDGRVGTRFDLGLDGCRIG